MGTPTEHDIEERALKVANDVSTLTKQLQTVIDSYLEQNKTRYMDDLCFCTQQALLDSIKGNILFWSEEMMTPEKRDRLKSQFVEDAIHFIKTMKPLAVVCGIH